MSLKAWLAARFSWLGRPPRLSAQELTNRLLHLEGQLKSLVEGQRDLAASFHGRYLADPDDRVSAEEYWTRHNVTMHARFGSARESLDYFFYRNQSYPGYIDLLPVSGWDDKVILDFGCGPGNDLVGFAHFSSPKGLIGIDISLASLKEAEARLRLHGAHADLMHLPSGSYEIPLNDASVDYVHCSGVLMLIEDPIRILREFRRVVKPDGEVRLMVYNYESIWLHLYVAYIVQLENGLYAERDVRDAFARTTDGEHCPLVRVWRDTDMEAMAAESGFASEFLGAAMSLWELHLLPKRFKAVLDPRLRRESRDFLLALTLDDRGYPLYRGHYAGVDACYRFRPNT